MLQYKKVKELTPDNVKQTICYTDKLLSRNIHMEREDLESLIREVADVFRLEGIKDSREDSAYLLYSKPDSVKNHLEIMQNEDKVVDELDVPSFINLIKLRSV